VIIVTGKPSAKAVDARMVNANGCYFPQKRILGSYMNGLHIGAAPGKLTGLTAGPVQ
jgi:hypothetical protein